MVHKVAKGIVDQYKRLHRQILKVVLILRYFLHLSYQGTNYQGYQRQTNAEITVQQQLEKTLSEILGQPTVFSGCGRTDAGVHASQYYGSIDLEKPWREEQLLILNRRLPTDISVFEVIPVAGNASPRFDATERRYDYFIHLDKQAGLADKSSWYPPVHSLDTDLMQTVLQQLTGRHDFRAYCKSPDRHNTTVCDLRRAELFVDPAGRHLRIHFAANRFLRGMIRLLVGNLLRIGEGRLDASMMLGHLRQQSPPKFFHLAPPDGLYLSGVDYPYINSINRSPLQQMLETLTD